MSRAGASPAVPDPVRPGARGSGAVSVRNSGRSSLADDCEDVAGAQDQVVLAVVLDLGAAVLGVDDLVADGDVQRDAVAVVVDPARADGEDLALLRLLLGGVRDDQTGLRGLLGFERRDEDAVLERLDRDRHLLTSTVDFAWLWFRLVAFPCRRGGQETGPLAFSTGECQLRI